MTDHEASKSIFNPHKSLPQLSAARLLGWSIILSAYVYEIRYKPDKQIDHDDALSRLPLPHVTTGVEVSCISVHARFDKKLLSFRKIAFETKNDDGLSTVLGYVNKEWLKENKINKGILVLLHQLP